MYVWSAVSELVRAFCYLCVKQTFQDCYAHHAMQSCTWCGLFEMLPRYGANYSCNKAVIPYLFLSSQQKAWYFIRDRIDNSFICRDNLVHIFNLQVEIMAVMDKVVGHTKNAACMRQKDADAHPKLRPTSKATLGSSSSSIGRLQSTMKRLDTSV